ncbi:MAG: 3-phosphoserine/phosphohydroxythreonine transaminase [Clostridiales bacterium]|jgi:phosphoserine aminotransferase|nr:3-phosphoserine/phosphohydroxythreonine transaminase [Clostridiales bacterium]
MERVFNFSAGPSVMPESVLKTAAGEMLNYHGSGMSVMEMSHRSKVFIEIANNTEALLREIMNIPENYKVLFLQGGASTQFSMIPMNLFRKSKKVDLLDTGQWATKAKQEASKYGTVNVVASSKDTNYDRIPELDKSKFDPEADYFHITSNNTIFGTKMSMSDMPDTGDVPLVCDMSSNILSEVYDVNKFGLIYAGAQKNMGPAGVTVVIIREDLLGFTLPGTPTMFDYKLQADNDSMYNTPPTYGIYIMGLVYQWIKDLGGVPAMHKINLEKAAVLYDYLDESKLFKGNVVKKDRSLMNVTYATGDADLDAKFIKGALALGMDNLKGYRTVGGMRASMYNAMPIEGAKALVDFMKKFEMENK